MKQQKYNLDIVHFYEMLGKFFYQRVWTIMKDTNGILTCHQIFKNGVIQRTKYISNNI